MPYEIHEDKIVMRAGKYNLPKCCCGEPFQLNTVHREKTPCFSYIERTWVGLTDDEAFELIQQDYRMEEYADAALNLVRRFEAKLKEKNQ